MMHRSGRLLGVGIDLVELDRARRLVRAHPAGVDRFLTPGESKLFKRAKNRALAFALIFSAKEAGSKALGRRIAGLAGFRDYSVFRQGARLGVRCSSKDSRFGGRVRIELFPFVWRRLVGMVAFGYRR